jgi:hypothetical protein
MKKYAKEIVDLPIQERLLRRTLPVFINSYNQHTYLKQLIEKLDRDEFKNLVVLDNNSTYPRLLSYYESLAKSGKVLIIYYGENRGPHFFHLRALYRMFGSLPHLYTDPDVSYDTLAPNFVSHLLFLAEKYSMFKVGPALEIPSDEEIDPGIFCHNKDRRYSVREWESQFWEKQIEEDVYYPGHIDTTFHLFHPKYVSKDSALVDGIRVGKQGFIFKHLPWYKKKITMDDEERLYRASALHSTWLTDAAS